MAWTLYEIPNEHRTELDAALKDDIVSRQSHTLRDAAAAGGPSGRLYVLVEGSPDGVARADELLKAAGTRMPPPEAERLYRQFKDEEDAASSGMGLFFTE
jgi:hypothetical protein